MARKKSIEVVFVCLGNICRSPMAEFIFKDKVSKKGLTNIIKVTSLGTSSYESGNDTYYLTKEILDKYNVPYKKRSSTKIKADDFSKYDYIIAMDHDNIYSLKRISNKYHNKINLLLDINEDTKGMIIPDPWYTRNFEETYSLLNSSLDMWLEKIIKDNEL